MAGPRGRGRGGRRRGGGGATRKAAGGGGAAAKEKRESSESESEDDLDDEFSVKANPTSSNTMSAFHIPTDKVMKKKR